MLVMNRPRVTGFDANRRPYEFNADRARQDVRSPRQVQLEKIDGRIELGAGGFARVTADRGSFDGELERFRAESNVHVTSSLGYEMFLEHADMDMRADVLTSDRPVEVRNGPNRIFGDRLRVTESGAVVVFDGNVRVIYHHEPAGE
jgi:lipopolysaccharide export system protein LptC